MQKRFVTCLDVPQVFKRPTMSRIGVDCPDDGALLRAGQAREPADLHAGLLRQVKAKRLRQHEMRKVLRHERCARPSFAQFLHHQLARPVERHLVSFSLEVDDGRQRPEQNVGMPAADFEAAAGEKHVSDAIVGDSFSVPIRRKGFACELRGQRRVARYRTGRPLGQMKQSPATISTGSPVSSSMSQQLPPITA